MTRPDRIGLGLVEPALSIIIMHITAEEARVERSAFAFGGIPPPAGMELTIRFTRPQDTLPLGDFLSDQIIRSALRGAGYDVQKIILAKHAVLISWLYQPSPSERTVVPASRPDRRTDQALAALHRAGRLLPSAIRRDALDSMRDVFFLEVNAGADPRVVGARLVRGVLVTAIRARVDPPGEPMGRRKPFVRGAGAAVSVLGLGAGLFTDLRSIVEAPPTVEAVAAGLLAVISTALVGGMVGVWRTRGRRRPE